MIPAYGVLFQQLFGFHQLRIKARVFVASLARLIAATLDPAKTGCCTQLPGAYRFPPLSSRQKATSYRKHIITALSTTQGTAGLEPAYSLSTVHSVCMASHELASATEYVPCVMTGYANQADGS